MNFLSDNAAPIAPAVLEAIVQANDGFAIAYGDDEWTRSVERHLSELFEREVAAFLVPTGTAANALALAHLTPPWGAVLCHADSHIATDECGAPEFFSGGLKLIGLSGQDGKVAAETLKGALSTSSVKMRPGSLSVISRLIVQLQTFSSGERCDVPRVDGHHSELLLSNSEECAREQVAQMRFKWGRRWCDCHRRQPLFHGQPPSA